MEREYHSSKSCAPYCTVSCVHQTAMLDRLREKPREAIAEILSARREHDASFGMPKSLRVLSWLFLTGSRRRVFQNIALRLLRVR